MVKVIDHRKPVKVPREKKLPRPRRYHVQRYRYSLERWETTSEHDFLWYAKYIARANESMGHYDYRVVDRCEDYTRQWWDHEHPSLNEEAS